MPTIIVMKGLLPHVRPRFISYQAARIHEKEWKRRKIGVGVPFEIFKSINGGKD